MPNTIPTDLVQQASACQPYIAPQVATIQGQIASLSTTKDQTHPAQLLAVTKTVGLKEMVALHQLGIRDFGENRVEVFLEKVEAFETLGLPVTWHYIGRVQSRQVKKIIDSVDFLHSLDRLSLAQEIEKRASHPIKCFVEVNVSGEESKAGFTPDALEDTFTQLAQLSKIQVVGLMTMAPVTADEAELHLIFGRLRELRDYWQIQTIGCGQIKELSMGMSRDYPIALEEGSTYIRVGTYLYQQLPS